MKAKYTWSYLAHLSTNMWYDRPPERFETVYRKIRGLSSRLLFSEHVWQEWTNRMQELGMNQVVIDVGDGVCYPSHPELAIEGSWSPQKMRDEIARLKAMGIEAIPKLNFSTTHDSWLKDYHRMVSTPEYYRVCEDLIGDIAETFGHPRFLHLGYDEESMGQTYADCSVARQGDLWWHDFLWFLKTTEKKGMRPWCWADAGWNHPDEFLSRCPKSTLLSNWYYGRSFDINAKRLKWYIQLDKAGFDQMPCGSNWSCPENFGGTVEFCRANLSAEHLKGFLMANWARTLPRYRDMGARSFDVIGEAMAIAERGERPPLVPVQMWVLRDGQIARWYKDVDRMSVGKDETLVVDFGRTATIKPVFEIEGGAGLNGQTLSVLPAMKMDGAGVEQPAGVEPMKTALRAGEHVYDDFAARECRFLGVTLTGGASITRIYGMSSLPA